MSSRPLSQSTLDDDRLNPKFNASTLDFLLIELVPLIQRVTEHTQAREQKLVEDFKKSKIFNTEHPASKDGTSTYTAKGDGSAKALAGVSDGSEPANDITSIGFPVVSESVQEGMTFRLDGLGYRVGQGLVERFSANKPRPSSPLDAIKFICKDLWQLLYRKQIDNLKTNHRGIFVLTDTRFQPLGRVSIDRRAGPKAAAESVARAQLHLHFPSGIIRGVLQGFGIEVTVSAEASEMPMATFQIKTRGAKP